MNTLLFAALLGLNFYGFAQSQLINNQFADFKIEPGSGVVDVYIADVDDLASLKDKIANTSSLTSSDFDLKDSSGALITEANFQQWKESVNGTSSSGTIVAK